MKSRILYIIIYIMAALFIISIYIFCKKDFRTRGREGAVCYESLYFVDNSLVNGASVIEAIKYFSRQELIILVKTKESREPEIYNFDGEKHIESYNEKRSRLESGYINKAALFKVSMVEKDDKIICVSFYQE